MEDRAFDIDDFGPVARILVIGVGGAGNNAVNRMIDDHIENVEFYVCNTDRQALATSKAPHRIPLGTKVTEGLGAGGDPSVGEEAAKQSEEEIRAIIRGDEAGGKKADMVFVAAGLGKGTGTGASPVIARIAKEEGALTIAIVTRPFGFEGPKRTSNAIEGLNKLKGAVDSIIIVSNDKLLMDSGNAPIDQAFSLSDNILSRSVKTVADLILAIDNTLVIGVVVFLIAQLIHLARLDWPHFRLPILIYSLIAATVIILDMILDFAPLMYVVCCFYVTALITNIIVSWRWYRQDRNNLLAFLAVTGFTLFLACDICTGVSYLSRTAVLPAVLFAPANFFAWAFYYPSQIFISNSSKCAKILTKGR